MAYKPAVTPASNFLELNFSRRNEEGSILHVGKVDLESGEIREVNQ